MNGDQKNVLIWGGRSKARIACKMLSERSDIGSLTIFDNTLEFVEFEFSGQYLNEIEDLRSSIQSISHFVVCIGGSHGYARVKIARFMENSGLKPLSLIHNKCYIDTSSKIGAGINVMPSATIHSDCSIGDYCIINTSSSIDHECQIGDGVHIMGAAAIAGRVHIEDYATVGTNATILPDLRIGTGAYIGAGAVVTKDVADNNIMVGSPARKSGTTEFEFSEDLLKRLGS